MSRFFRGTTILREKIRLSKGRLLTFLLKCEVFREMTALVVTSEEEECGRMAQFQRPQVQHALKKRNMADSYRSDN